MKTHPSGPPLALLSAELPVVPPLMAVTVMNEVEVAAIPCESAVVVTISLAAVGEGVVIGKVVVEEELMFEVEMVDVSIGVLVFEVMTVDMSLVVLVFEVMTVDTSLVVLMFEVMTVDISPVVLKVVSEVTDVLVVEEVEVDALSHVSTRDSETSAHLRWKVTRRKERGEEG